MFKLIKDTALMEDMDLEIEKILKEESEEDFQFDDKDNNMDQGLNHDVESDEDIKAPDDDADAKLKNKAKIVTEGDESKLVKIVKDLADELDEYDE